MKCKRILYLVIIVGLLISCNNNSNEKKYSDKKVEQIFSPVLEKNIINFINYVHSTKPDRIDLPKKIYIIYSYFENGKCYIDLNSDYYYDKTYINGYTFLNDELIVFYSYQDSCIAPFLQIDKLTQFRDSITGYEDVAKIDMHYELPKRVFRVINSDSLETIYTGGKYQVDIDALENTK